MASYHPDPAIAPALKRYFICRFGRVLSDRPHLLWALASIEAQKIGEGYPVLLSWWPNMPAEWVPRTGQPIPEING